MKTSFLKSFFAAALLTGALSTRAQWTTQNLDLKTGWSAIFLHVDCTHTNMAALVADRPEVQEVWMWAPAPTTAQFVTSPDVPSFGFGSQWIAWKRAEAVNKLSSLPANTAYLVRSSADCVWGLKGQPRLPRPQWSVTGLNFLGYPTPPSAPPTFDAFFAQAPDVRQALEVFYYSGGELGANNPRQLDSFLFWGKNVKRGEAYWLRAGNLYHGASAPFEVKMIGVQGVEFGDVTSQKSFRIKNLHASSNRVTLTLLASETAPALQQAVMGTPPLLVRGAQNLTNLTYYYTELGAGGTASWMLNPAGQLGSEVEVVVGVNRYTMTGTAGDLKAGILRLTDSLGLAQVDMPLTATVISTAGLWVGNAKVSSVNSYLKTFQKDDDGAVVSNPNGAYQVLSTNTDAGPVARAFPLRLILHNNAAGNAKLLAKVFYGPDLASNAAVSLREANLDPKQLTMARRISAPHLPWSSGNTPWALAGELRQGGSLTGVVTTAYSDQSSNPFLHTYHPDHDNMDASFASIQPQGYESYGITRRITLNVTPPAPDFQSLTASGQVINGFYAEEITLAGRGTETRTFNVSGVFALNRLSSIPTLTP